MKENPREMSVMTGLDGILNKVETTVGFLFKRREGEYGKSG